jgi:RNA polymerase sigma-70 factor (ECF subfamily)
MPENLEHEDYQLITNAQQDPEAFRELYNKYVDQIFQFVYYRVGSHREEAQDITAEVFTRALKLLPKFKWQGFPYSAYLYRVARSVCQEYYRKEKPTEGIADTVIVDTKSMGSETQADLQLLWKRIQKYGPDIVQIFELRYLEDRSYEEIAAIVGKSPGTIRTAVSRTIDKLQASYGQTTD